MIRRVCAKKSADRRAKVFSKLFNLDFLWELIEIYLEMIPINKHVIKDWYEFEGASTYEYAHVEVKAAYNT